jgi:hypothetical protein
MSSARAFVLLAALLAASAASADVDVDFDREAEFSAYRTYGWQEGTPARNEEVEATIRRAVDRELRAHGLRPVEPDVRPDLWVATHASSEEKTFVNPYTFGSGWANPARGKKGHVEQDRLEVGTLIVDLVDAEAARVVWRGVATEAISSNPKKISKKVDKVTRKMFRSYPPRGR